MTMCTKREKQNSMRTMRKYVDQDCVIQFKELNPFEDKNWISFEDIHALLSFMSVVCSSNLDILTTTVSHLSWIKWFFIMK